TLRLPMMIAILSAPARLAPLAELYRRAGAEAGHKAERLRIGIASHFHVQKESQQALDEFFPYYASYFRHSVPARGGWHLTRADYEQNGSLQGGLFVGSPQQIID